MRTLLRLGRATIAAAAIAAASGMLESSGGPLFATIGKAAINFGAAQSETERLRTALRQCLRRPVWSASIVLWPRVACTENSA